MAQPAGLSSSSSFTREWTYDIFLSFRGQDTRNTFTGNLYNSLDQKGIYTFIDDEELGRGEQIRPALLKAIQESRIAIIVFSKNYAESTFCLDELVEILEHLKAKGRLVWPVFYDVDPSEVRHQRGSYAEALAKLEERFRDDKGKVQKWREALHEAANLSGSYFKPGSQPEYKFIDNIISKISKKLRYTPLHVADNPVGLESPVLEVKYLIGLGSNDGVDMVGICGTGGIGKTTIARAVYNLFVDHFDGLCFLTDIRENAHKHGLPHLQETLLSEILGEDIKIRDVNKGIPLIKRRLQRKKVLLILDDVGNREQLKAIAGEHDRFGPGSRIIITSRDRHLLSAHGVKFFYEVKELNKKEALELFTWNAFGSNKVNPSFADVVSRALSYVGGLPLALEVIGSNLYNRSINEWNSALDKYERIPNTKVDKILKISYEGLEEDEKNVFLDIACFFNKYERSYVNEMMHARGFHPEHSIEVLIDKSLMKIDIRNDCVRMHDLIQDMGREIVRQESTSDPGKRSRLWFDDDIVHVLQNDMGTAEVEVIFLYSRKYKEVHWNGNAFKKMRNLRVLVVRNAHFSVSPEHLPNTLRVLDWNGYPSPFLPSDFHPNELFILRLRHSCIKLDKQLKMFVSLGCMDFKGCEFLVRVPNLSGIPNLKELCLDNCRSLLKVDDSIGFLDKLISLSARGCVKLHTLVPAINLPSLETLGLDDCTGLQWFPEVLGVMENVRKLHLSNTAIEELPDSISNLVGLEWLDLRQCRNLSQFPDSIELLPKVKLALSSHQRGFRLYEPEIVREAVEFRGLPCLVQVDRNFFALFSSLGVSLSDVQITQREGSLVCFWFHKRFPESLLQPLFEPRGKHVPSSAFVLSINVLINGTFQFNSVRIYYNSAARLPNRFSVSLGDCLREFPQNVVERVLSLQEWNHAEISCELKCHMPYFPPQSVSGGKRRSIAAVPIKQSIVYVYKKGYCMKDLKFLDCDGLVSTCAASCYCNESMTLPASMKIRLGFIPRNDRDI